MDTINVVKWMLYLMSLISLGVSKHGSRECPYEPYDPQDTHPLINLGNSLKHRLSILNQPCPYGRLIFKDLVKYYNRLSDVYRLLKRRDIVDIVKMYKVYAEVNKTGGPPHLNIMMDYEGLQKTYDWRDKEEVKAIKQVGILYETRFYLIYFSAENSHGHYHVQTFPQLYYKEDINFCPKIKTVGRNMTNIKY